MQKVHKKWMTKIGAMRPTKETEIAHSVPKGTIKDKEGLWKACLYSWAGFSRPLRAIIYQLANDEYRQLHSEIDIPDEIRNVFGCFTKERGGL